MSAFHLPVVRAKTPAWNKGRIIGQKRPLLPKHVWAIRVRLEMAENIRDVPRWTERYATCGSGLKTRLRFRRGVEM